MAAKFEEIIPLLVRHEIQFILIGGVAAIAHGSARATFAVDIVYSRTEQNIRKLLEAIRPLNPYLRGAPPALPFVWDDRTVRNGLNFTLTTSLGDLDLLGEVAGGGSYEQLLPYCDMMTLYGSPLYVVRLERLIQLKRAAGRPKDLEAIAELQALLEERANSKGQEPA